MKNKKSIDIFPALTFAAGFYAGYKEASGVDLHGSVEFLTKYAPTLFSVFLSSELPNLFNKFSKGLRKGIEEGNLNITHQDPIYGTTIEKRYSDETFENQVKISAGVHKFERQTEDILKDKKSLEKTFYSGAITGTTTLLGYWAGSAASMIKYINS